MTCSTPRDEMGEAMRRETKPPRVVVGANRSSGSETSMASVGGWRPCLVHLRGFAPFETGANIRKAKVATLQQHLLGMCSPWLCPQAKHFVQGRQRLRHVRHCRSVRRHTREGEVQYQRQGTQETAPARRKP